MVITHGPEDGPLPREGIEQELHIGAWKVTLWRPLLGAAGGPQEIRIEPREDGDPQEIARGISTTVLRQIDTAAFAADTDSVAQEVIASKTSVEKLREELAALPGGLSNEYLAVLSALYVRSVDAGRRAPIHDLEVWTGTKQATLKGHLRAARQKGFLTKVEGKAGGQLTNKAIEILRGMDVGEGSEEV
ncbi:hypothetical protein PV620_23405 [Streptomyces sp. ME02-6978a]|uniref:hypothetical protein n=1 Tax=unclassified Streptomyces TaxID=2593676 RepID=UPI0029B0ADC4|nr:MULTISPECIES: hypothetical protein [unclassified Streptomyces]MDX3090990.1 hypothetical protein [Streptomyces sp. ME12-02E]MDX3334492.1 hypothetical protein [Streptomyces sp. ME02-6978a]